MTIKSRGLMAVCADLPQEALARRNSSRIQVDVVLCFVAISPCIAYYAFACAATIYLGRWPHYAHPDPKDLPSPFGVVMLPVFLVQSVWILAVFPILIFASARMWNAERFSRFGLAALPALFVIATWIILGSDPHGVLDWFWD